MSDYTYEGSELDLFAAATNWKAYVRRHVAPWIGQAVLEVGAGNGSTTQSLCQGDAHDWVCLEPDAALAARVTHAIVAGKIPSCCRVVIGTLNNLPETALFDTILYMDVLEHIKDDRAEVEQATLRLQPGGHLIVLGPAHQWLFTPFDQAVGHHRRYTKQSLRAAANPRLELVRLVYLDAVGVTASLANRLLLQSALPTKGQLAVWDRIMVPLSRLVDPLLFHQWGKSILAIWRRRAE